MIVRHSNRALFIWIFLILMVVGPGCGDDPPTGIDPHTPRMPTAPFPADNGSDQPVKLILQWSCSDPDGDELTYTVYFGTRREPLPVDTVVVDTVFDPGPLLSESTYYWRIVARDPYGHLRSSPVWRFSTGTGFVYPLAIGNRWEYAGVGYFFNIRPDSMAEAYSDTMSSSSVVHITSRATIMDSIETYVFQETLAVAGETYETETYFDNLADGLYYYGHSGMPNYRVIPLKISPGQSLHFKGRDFNSSAEIFDLLKSGATAEVQIGDSIIYEYMDPAVLSLRYPLELGAEWVMREAEFLGQISKRVNAWVNIGVPAGSFDCYVIQRLYDLDEDGEWDDDIEFFDYLNRDGLLKRSIIVRTLEITGFEEPTGVTTVDLYEEFVLTDFHVE